ncbi:MAG: hypothetical protein ABIT38_03295 [Gemmatimonadaceae bacterium]
MTWRPVRDGKPDVSAIDVRWVLRSAPWAGDSALTLMAPIVYAGVTGIAERIEGLEVRDTIGVLSTVVSDDAVAAGGFPYFRHWQFSRRVEYPLSVRYRARVQPAGGRNAPPFGIRSVGGGVSGAGPGFLLIPEDDRPHAIRIHWDLADLGAAARGVTSFGEGDVQIVAPPSDLYETWIMAGEPSRYPNVHKTQGGGREEEGDEWFIGTLPTMAASAWYWEAIDRRGRSVDSLYREAAAFAAGDYANALIRHSDASLRAGVAARVAEYIALPPAFVTEHKLRVSRDDWMLHVLQARGLRTGMLDTRVTAVRDTTRRGGLADPALGGGMLRIGKEMLAPALVPESDSAKRAAIDTARKLSTVERYLRRELGYATLESYRSLNLDINGVWKYKGMKTPNEDLAVAMRARPMMRVFWGAGYFDLTTPAFATERDIDAKHIDRSRVTTMLLPGPHGIFSDPSTRTAAVTRLRAWIREVSTIQR